MPPSRLTTVAAAARVTHIADLVAWLLTATARPSGLATLPTLVTERYCAAIALSTGPPRQRGLPASTVVRAWGLAAAASPAADATAAPSAHRPSKAAAEAATPSVEAPEPSS